MIPHYPRSLIIDRSMVLTKSGVVSISVYNDRLHIIMSLIAGDGFALMMNCTARPTACIYNNLLLLKLISALPYYLSNGMVTAQIGWILVAGSISCKDDSTWLQYYY